MENNNGKKFRYHSIGRVFFDILRDNNSLKYSMTKFAALVGLVLFVIISLSGIYIMIHKNEVDYILVGEILTFILTLLGFKNLKGKDGKEDVPVTPQVNNKQLLTEDNNINNGAPIDLRG